MVLKATQLGGFGGGGDAFEPFEVTFLGSDVTPDSTGTTNTFNSYSLGAASASRKIYLFIYYVTDTNFVNSVTIGGVSAQFVGGNAAAGATPDIQVDLWLADVPTGATGNVAITFGSAYTSAIGIAGYRSVGGTDQIKIFNTAFQDTGTTLNQIAGLIAQKNTVILGASQDANANTFTWTNVDENADVDSGGTNPFRLGAASRTFNTHQGQTDVTVASIASGSTPQVSVLCVISGNRDPEGNWLQGGSNAANQSSYTFTDFALGANPSYGREKRVFVIVSADGSAVNLDSATIDGVAATIHATSATGVAPRCWIISRKGDFTPLGTVVVNFSGTVNNCSILSIKTCNLVDNAPHDVETNTTGSGTSVGVNIDIPNKGILLANHRHANTNNASLSGITLRDQGDVETQEATAGFEDNRAAGTGVSVSASWTTAVAGAIACLSWK